MKSQITIFIFLFLLTAFPMLNTAQAAPIVKDSMGWQQQSREGQCLPKKFQKISLADAKGVISRHNINATGATTEETIALGRGLLQIENLYGGTFKPMAHAKFKYTQKNDTWRQTKSGIEIHRHWHHKSHNNTNMLIHELAHYIGNNHSPDNPVSYSNYRANVRGKCDFSGYGKTNRNEEYAEVFSAFIMAPHLLLQQNTQACTDAFNFFKRQLHRNKKATAATCSGRSANNFDLLENDETTPSIASTDDKVENLTAATINRKTTRRAASNENPMKDFFRKQQDHLQ